MLLKLSDQISECLSLAADARERANVVTDPRRKEDFLDMERRWLRLVESYRFVEQAARFLEDSDAARSPSTQKLPKRPCWSSRARPQAKISRRAL